MLRSCRWLVVFWGLASVSPSRAAGPADDLLKLVPADTGATLVVENFRDRYREILASPLIEAAGRLPMVEGWLRSGTPRHLARAGRELETALGLSVSAFRDEIMGDAVVLTLRPGPLDAPDQSRGLLLVRPRSRATLAKLIDEINKNQVKSGEVLSIEARDRKGQKYGVRNFKAGRQPTEYFAFLSGDVFALTNSEDLIQGVIDRKVDGSPGLWDQPSFQKTRQGLPAKVVASLFLNPRFLERVVFTNPLPMKTEKDRMTAMLARYVAAVDYAGLAFQVQDGFYIHSREVIAPERLEPWLKRWLTGPSRSGPLINQVPDSALAVVAADINFDAFREAAERLVSEEARPNLENYRLGFLGILLGRDPITQILPRLGPSTLSYIEIDPDRGVRTGHPVVSVVSWQDQAGGPEMADAIDNALRTAMAFYAVSPSRQSKHLKVETRMIGEAKITELTDGTRTRVSFRVDRNRVILSRTPGAAARFGASRVPSNLARIREKSFPNAETYAIVEFSRLLSEVRLLRAPIALQFAARSHRPITEVDRDLDQLLAVADLFQAGWFTSVAEPDGSSIHRTVGLLAR